VVKDAVLSEKYKEMAMKANIVDEPSYMARLKSCEVSYKSATDTNKC
jgi:hypothetical protein